MQQEKISDDTKPATMPPKLSPTLARFWGDADEKSSKPVKKKRKK
jgi:hypothetical protein